MCGIAGILDRSGDRPEPALLERMRDVMVTRGPDDCGLWSAPGIGLAHRRLSIIDRSPAGHQPMCNEDETIWIVFNGEIYDFDDLRDELRTAGHRFRSRTDTEVIIHAYEEWGTERLLQRLHGMFAFALWDGPRRRLLLARDRLGKKPLFYADLGNRFYFSSDIKSIWLAAGDRLTVDPHAIDEFLYFYFIMQDRSIYREVRKLPAASFMEVEPERARSGRYWTLDYTHRETRDEQEWLERCEVTIQRAVKRRMVADVPLGAFLSGGVDSSLVVAMMSQASARPVKTFSIGLGVAGYNELGHAREVAARYHSDHEEFVAEPNAWEILPQLVWHYGEPFGDSSAVPTFLVSSMARHRVTVALTGDGGDEAFAGYPSYAAVHRGERCWWVPRWVRRDVLARAGEVLHGEWPAWRFASRLRSLANNFSGDPVTTLKRDMGWGEPHRELLYSDEMKALLGRWHPAEGQRPNLMAGGWDTASDGWRLAVIRTLLPSDYLVKIDVASMMSSLEVRCPFLDTEVLELTSRVPVQMLLGPQNRSKSLLRKLALKYLPAETVLRPKHGFELPIAEWLRGPWRKAVRALVLSDRALRRGYFRRQYVDQVLTAHERGADHRHRIWCLLWLELWHRMFVDRTLMPADQLPLD
jgi:asparagine synthase (glutamine-hydrolysing)